MAPPTKTPVFISFDYDHDAALKAFLVGQAKNEKSPFFIQDWSIRRASKRWKEDAKGRIRRCNVVIAICGRHTNKAAGVTAEIQIAREVGVRYALLRGYKDGRVERPAGTSWFSDEIYDWTWDNLVRLTDTRPWWQKIW